MKRRKILYHVTPDTDASPIYHEMVSQLALGMQAQADVDLSAALDDHPRLSLADYDLVHVFGCWNKVAANLMARAYREHVPTVFSPLGGLQPWVMKQRKSSLALSSQREMTSRALAVHVCGKLEHDTFLSLKWNNRVALIKNPVLTSKVSFSEMASQMDALYQKVIDTFARLLLSDSSCRLIGELLVAGIDDTLLRDHKRVGVIRSGLSQLDEAEWRKIYLYASDECVLETLRQGLARLQMDAPDLPVDTIDRYPRHLHYTTDSLEGDKLLSRNPLTKSKLSDIIDTDEKKERRIIVRLLNLKYKMERNEAPLSHLADLYQSVRFVDADEDRLNEVARAMGVLEFAERLMAVLHHTFGLTEGFMPFRERADKASLAMVNHITKFNTY